ncbi:PDGLE domain-containing protein [Effusibacillus lacus]|uniref:Membrane protein n=1 Tax=Effusibacillus lacus TaxID=1348429 RepID=A0A292YM59_9BACL|nr:PDGLE domain-containing protein [Effusibacillus lacus]TCS71227.1 cobalt/nickel transport protein [Effusibacillus lacus]GAX89853.1 membrane protein [Effusibacillus lacus]
MKRIKGFAGAGITVSLLLGGFISPFASSKPDGLERSAIELGFMEKETGTIWTSPFADYTVANIEHSFFSTSIAGLLGTLLTLLTMITLGRWWVRKTESARKKG